MIHNTWLVIRGTYVIAVGSIAGSSLDPVLLLYLHIGVTDGEVLKVDIGLVAATGRDIVSTIAS